MKILKKRLEKYQKNGTSSQLIFPGRSGQIQIHPYKKSIQQAFERAGVRRPCQQLHHAFRHFFASKLIESGANPKEVQELLGHAGIQITLDQYTHLFPGQKRVAIERLQCLG